MSRRLPGNSYILPLLVFGGSLLPLLSPPDLPLPHSLSYLPGLLANRHFIDTSQKDVLALLPDVNLGQVILYPSVVFDAVED
ncbi:hypothetical protein STEG23_011061 [Scotinomys teguina]